MSAPRLAYDHHCLVHRGSGPAPESVLVAVIGYVVETFAYAAILPPLFEALALITPIMPITSPP